MAIVRETFDTLSSVNTWNRSNSSRVGVVDSANARVGIVGIGARILAIVQGSAGIAWIVTDLAPYGSDTCRGDKKSNCFVKLIIKNYRGILTICI